MKTVIISAFPGSGKTHFYKSAKDKGLVVLDSDSSTFDKKDFPGNYIKHIKNNMGKVDIIMVSSHKEVRDALVENGIHFKLVYPDKDLKIEYLTRYQNRGSDVNFLKLLDKNWRSWLLELAVQKGCDKFVLGKGQYLSDIMEDLTK